MQVNPKDAEPVSLDLKGKVFKGQPIQCNTMLVVDLSATEAKVTHVIDKALLMQCVQNDLSTENVIEVSFAGDARTGGNRPKHEVDGHEYREA